MAIVTLNGISLDVEYEYSPEYRTYDQYDPEEYLITSIKVEGTDISNLLESYGVLDKVCEDIEEKLKEY
jgi:hypothetical protein